MLKMLRYEAFAINSTDVKLLHMLGGRCKKLASNAVLMTRNTANNIYEKEPSHKPQKSPGCCLE
jgi:hypothetical protein